jgi:transcriptional regulator with GAF, ATPase, and Fis domain
MSSDETATVTRSSSLEFSLTRRRSIIELAWTDADGLQGCRLDSRMVVGSARQAQVHVEDPTVSRLHAELELRDDGVWVKDLRSRNGTFVNDLLIAEARVPIGARLQMGRTAFTLRSSDESETVELWPHDRFGGLIGHGETMRELFRRLAKIAATESTVLVQGETGTGKELIARAVHEASARREGPYVIVDCAALPENLLEAELFGHAKGAFTGAAAARVGAVEAASGGTLFLDEVGELPLVMQPKLLRVLESRTIRRVGEVSERPVDVRVVAATHRDLREMVNSGAFREDLYFRLAVIPLSVPPLRERREDIPALVRHFLGPERQALLSEEELAELRQRPWLGNVRELRNVVERVVALGLTEALQLEPRRRDSDALTVDIDLPFKEVRERWTSRLEREYMQAQLARTGRNISEIATASGLDRTYVHRLLKKHNL